MLITNARRFPDGAEIAVLVEGERIAQVIPAAGPRPMASDQRIDAQGKWLLPAFVENHLHLFAGGVTLDELDLSQVSGRAALAQALAEFRAGREAAPLLSCYGANYALFGADTRPDRHQLDSLCPDQALVVMAVDFHTAWANTEALRRAGLMAHVPALESGEIVTDAQGVPTGELREFGAMMEVLRLAPNGGRSSYGLIGAEPEGEIGRAARETDKATILRALEKCTALGITFATNMDGNLYQAALFAELAAEDRLPISVSLPMCLTAGHSPEQLDRLFAQACQPPMGKLSFGRIKLFMDGVFDSWTALRTDDYPGRQGFRGAPLFPAARFAELCQRADALALQLSTHAVGDGAVRAVIDGYEAAITANGKRDARHRIEHLDMCHPDDLARMRDLGIVASMQPVHPPGSSGLPLEPTVSIMGRARWPDTFAWRRIREAGIGLVFSTDWPTAPLDPRNAIHAALSRKPWAPDIPDQRLDQGGVLDAYWSARAIPPALGCRRGAIAAGMAADLVEGEIAALAQSPTACRVAMTIAAGKVVFSS